MATVYDNIGVTYKSMGNFKEALKYLKKSMAIREEILDPRHPDLVTSYSHMGDTYLSVGNFKNAIEYYKKVSEIDTTVITDWYYNDVGIAYAKNNQMKKAEHAFIEYQKIYPDDGDTYRNWAMFYALKGNKEKALSQLQKAVDL